MTLNRPVFDTIPVSTKTVIATTNWNVDIKKLFKFLPITPYHVLPKKRGRKKKVEMVDLNKDVPNGSIVTLKYQETPKHEKEIRGVEVKHKKGSDLKGYFRNSVTVVMKVDDKLLNFKISKNGKFQITGCKTDNQAEMCMKHIWQHISSITMFKSPEKPFVILFNVMTNIDFNVGFTVNRESLDNYIVNNTSFNSLLETSMGYAGCNVKIPITIPLDLTVPRIELVDGTWTPNPLSYKDFLDTMPEKEKKKEMNKKRYNTLLIFHSGQVISSCVNKELMKETYNSFFNLMEKGRDVIEERLDEIES